MSATRMLKRPTWSNERRLERATSRSGLSVSSAPFAMWCILGMHGPFVHPPSPYSRERASVYPQAAALVVARRARSPLAPHARSVPRARLRVHVAADAGESSGGVLSEIPGAVSEPRVAGPSSAARREGGLGGAGILCAGAESPCARKERCRERRCRERRCREKRSRERRCRIRRCQTARRSRRTHEVARHRTVHCRGGGMLRLRESSPCSRYQREPCDTASIHRTRRGTPHPATQHPATPHIVHRVVARPEERETSMEIQSGGHGARSAGMSREKAQVSGMPGEPGMQNAQRLDAADAQGTTANSNRSTCPLHLFSPVRLRV